MTETIESTLVDPFDEPTVDYMPSRALLDLLVSLGGKANEPAGD
jgi:hypothetical protein